MSGSSRTVKPAPFRAKKPRKPKWGSKGYVGRASLGVDRVKFKDGVPQVEAEALAAAHAKLDETATELGMGFLAVAGAAPVIGAQLRGMFQSKHRLKEDPHGHLRLEDQVGFKGFHGPEVGHVTGFDKGGEVFVKSKSSGIERLRNRKELKVLKASNVIGNPWHDPANGRFTHRPGVLHEGVVISRPDPHGPGHGRGNPFHASTDGKFTFKGGAVRKALAAAARGKQSSGRDARSRAARAQQVAEYLDSGREARNKERQVASAASRLHDDWRKPRQRKDGSYEPRVKPTKDAGWVKAHGKSEVDIANTPYKDLPADWKRENELSARGGIAAAQKFPNDIEKAAAMVHDQWLERNGSWAPPEQKKPYSQLSDEEKEKDRVVVRHAMRALRESAANPPGKLAEGVLNRTQRAGSATIVRPNRKGSGFKGTGVQHKFPIPDKAHARAAMARINQSDLTPAEKAKVMSIARAKLAEGTLLEVRKHGGGNPRHYPKGAPASKGGEFAPKAGGGDAARLLGKIAKGAKLNGGDHVAVTRPDGNHVFGTVSGTFRGGDIELKGDDGRKLRVKRAEITHRAAPRGKGKGAPGLTPAAVKRLKAPSSPLPTAAEVKQQARKKARAMVPKPKKKIEPLEIGADSNDPFPKDDMGDYDPTGDLEWMDRDLSDEQIAASLTKTGLRRAARAADEEGFDELAARLHRLAKPKAKPAKAASNKAAGKSIHADADGYPAGTSAAQAAADRRRVEQAQVIVVPRPKPRGARNEPDIADKLRARLEAKRKSNKAPGVVTIPEPPKRKRRTPSVSPDPVPPDPYGSPQPSKQHIQAMPEHRSADPLTKEQRTYEGYGASLTRPAPAHVRDIGAWERAAEQVHSKTGKNYDDWGPKEFKAATAIYKHTIRKAAAGGYGPGGAQPRRAFAKPIPNAPGLTPRADLVARRVAQSVTAGRAGGAVPDLPHAPISQLADVIDRDWKNVSPHARPYLDAMRSLRTMDDKYGLDSADEIIARFLGNATGWRGDKARQVKAELKRRLRR